MARIAAPFSFHETMQRLAQQKALHLDSDQTRLISELDSLAAPLLARRARFAGLYVWGRPGRGKSFIVDNFSPRCRSRRKNAPTFMTSFANSISAWWINRWSRRCARS